MIPTKRIWTARPLLAAYVVVVGFTVGLLVNRNPAEPRAVPAITGRGIGQHGSAAAAGEAREPPLWLQLFRPSQPTARLILRTGLPMLAVADGSALERRNRNLMVHWTGRAGEKPQTFFQILLPFMIPEPRLAKVDPPMPTDPPVPLPAPTAPPVAEPQPPVSPPTAGKGVVNGGLPLVGIYHSHDYESYISEFPDLKISAQRDLIKIASYDHSRRTVVGLGDLLALELRSRGITTVHAPFKHQELGYAFAYKAARVTARQILKEHPSTRIMIDLHRDEGWGLNTTAVVQGQKTAMIRCIIGDQQTRWEENKAFCDRLMERLEAAHSGITFPTRVQGDTYNQDLIPGAILLEIGAALNTYAESERSVRLLAGVLEAMIRAGEYPQ